MAVPIEGISCDTAAALLPVEDRPVDAAQTAQADTACAQARQAALAHGRGQVRAGLLSAEQLISGDRYLFFRDAFLQRRQYLIKDGQVKEQIVGAVDKSVITKALDKHL